MRMRLGRIINYSQVRNIRDIDELKANWLVWWL